MDALAAAAAEHPGRQSIGGRHLVSRIIVAQKRRRLRRFLCPTVDTRGVKAERRSG